MINCHTDRDSATPLYSQIYESIRDSISCGRIAENEKLPSKRSLASYLDVSVLTVQTAYEQLLSEGYIYSLEKRGYFACDAGIAPLSGSLRSGRAGLEEKEPESRREEDFPMSSWMGVMRKVMNENSALGGTGNSGRAELRAALSEYIFRFRGMEVEASNIVVGAGAEYLYDIIVKLLGRDKLYALEDPGYGKVRKVLEINGAEAVSVPVDGGGLICSELAKSGGEIVHVTPAHHFPTGAVMPATRRAELLRWAAEGNRYIIEDDYDSEFRRRPLPTLYSMNKGERVIYINTFSNTLSRSIRISYMVLPEELMEHYRTMFSFCSCTVPTLEQLTLARFMREGYFERHLNRLRKKYSQRREELKNAALGMGFNVRDSLSGLHFLVETGDEARAKARLKAGGKKVSFVSDHSVLKPKSMEGLAVVNLTEVTAEELKEGLKLIKAAP